MSLTKDEVNNLCLTTVDKHNTTNSKTDNDNDKKECENCRSRINDYIEKDCCESYLCSVCNDSYCYKCGRCACPVCGCEKCG